MWRIIDLDSVKKLKNVKRADKIMVCNDIVVIIEETGEAEDRRRRQAREHSDDCEERRARR